VEFIALVGVLLLFLFVLGRDISLANRIKRLETQVGLLRRRLAADQSESHSPEEGSVGEVKQNERPLAEPEEQPTETSEVVPPPPPPKGPPPLPQRPRAERVERLARPGEETRKGEPATFTPSPSNRTPLTTTIVEKLKKLGPDEDMTWEQALGTFWLPRIGIAALSIAVVFLLTFAAQRFGPPVRIGIGYAVCAVLIGIAWRLEKRYRLYARVLYAGGIALSYFVTYATYYVPYARVFDSPWIALGLLAAIVVAWGIVAQRRQSRIVAIMVTALGHLTIGTATFSLDEPGAFSVVGIVALSVGSAFFLLRNRWYYIAALGLVGSYANHFFVMAQSPATDAVSDFVMGMSVLSAYLVIFAGAELFAPEELRREKVPVWFRSLFVSTNTVAFLVLGSLIVQGFEFSQDYQYILRYGLAVFLLAIAVAYLQRRANDPLHNAYLTKAIAIATLGLAAQFEGNTLSVSLAVEMVVLLAAARRSGLVVMRLLAFGVAVIAFAHGMYADADTTFIAYSDPAYISAAAQAALIVLAFLAAALLYEKTDWTQQAPGALPVNKDLLTRLWQLDIVSEKPEGADVAKPFRGLLIPYVFVAAALILLIEWTTRLLPMQDRPLETALIGLALLIAAVILRSRPFVIATLVTAPVVMVWGVLAPEDLGQFTYGDPAHTALVLKMGGAVIALGLMSEVLRRVNDSARMEWRAIVPTMGYFVPQPKLWNFSFSRTKPESDQHETVSPLMPALATLPVLVVTIYHLTLAGDRALTAGMAAALLVAVGYALRSLPVAFLSLLMAAFAFVFGTVEMMNGPAPMAAAVTLLALVFPSIASEPFIPTRRALALHQATPIPYLLYAVPAWLFVLFITDFYPAHTAAFVIAAAAVAAAASNNVLHRKALSWCSGAFVAWASLLWLFVNLGEHPWQWRILALGLIVLALALDRYVTWTHVPGLGAILIINAWLLAMAYAVGDAATEWIGFFWAVIAFAFTTYGAGFRSRTAAALAVLAGAGASVWLPILAYDEPLGLWPTIAGFGAAAVFWILWERISAIVANKLNFKAAVLPAPLFVAIATALLVVMLERIPALAEFLLTVSWSLLAVALFAIALAFREKLYRYAGLAVLLLAALRVIAIDTRELEAIPKVIAWGILGIVLMALGFGYVKAFANGSEASKSAAGESESHDD